MCYFCVIMSNKTEKLIVRLTPELKEQAISAAQRDRRKLSDWIRITIEDAVKPVAYTARSPLPISIGTTGPSYVTDVEERYWDDKPDVFLGIIEKHGGEMWGSIKVVTMFGNYPASNWEGYEKEIGQRVLCEPYRGAYRTVKIRNLYTPDGRLDGENSSFPQK